MPEELEGLRTTRGRRPRTELQDDDTISTGIEAEQMAILDIQPLRDLARNFDLDIEPYLQEYLQSSFIDDEFRTIEEEANPSGWNIENFVTAALKIQNSVVIYNRKVDFLYQSVYEVFHEFIQSIAAESSNGKKKKPSTGGDADIEKFDAFDPDQMFLLLDDVLPIDRTEGKRKINLYDEVENFPEGTLKARRKIDDHLHANGLAATTPENNLTILSLGGVMSASQLELDGTFVFNKESIGKTSPSAISRMLMANLQCGDHSQVSPRGGEGNLRLLGGMCDIGKNGALLMPGTCASVFINGEPMTAAQAVQADDTTVVENIEIFPVTSSPEEARIGDSEMFEPTLDGDDHDDGVVLHLNNDTNDDRVEVDLKMEPNSVPQELDASSLKKKLDDPWAVLDPHKPSNDKPKPLRIGISYCLPPGLDIDDRPSTSVTGSRTKSKGQKSARKRCPYNAIDLQRSPFVTDLLDQAAKSKKETNEYSDSTNSSSSYLSTFLKSKDLIFGEEFAYVYKAHLQHRNKIQEEQNGSTNTGFNCVNEGRIQCNNFEDENDDFCGVDGVDYDCDETNSYATHEELKQNETAKFHQSNVDFKAIDDVFMSVSLNDDGNNDIDSNTNLELSFEELCRSHLRKFTKSAEIYQAETHLTKRVGVWQNGLISILEEQEQRPQFDIHSIGRQILQNVEKNLTIRKRTSSGVKKLDKPSSQSNFVDFQAIAYGLKGYEVSRLFLSTLMLCNSGNITVHDGGDVTANDSLQIELIHSKFDPPMESFLPLGNERTNEI